MHHGNRRQEEVVLHHPSGAGRPHAGLQRLRAHFQEEEQHHSSHQRERGSLGKDRCSGQCVSLRLIWTRRVHHTHNITTSQHHNITAGKVVQPFFSCFRRNLGGEKRTWKQLKMKHKNLVQSGKTVETWGIITHERKSTISKETVLPEEKKKVKLYIQNKKT